MNEYEPPGYDDWFDDPEPPTLESGRGSRSSYDLPTEMEEDVWTLPEDEPRRRRGASGEVMLGNVALTKNQVAILAVAALAIFIAILAAFGAFSSDAAPTTPTIVTTHPTTTQTTQTTPTIQVPTETLKSGDTGPQVKLLQKALAAAGFSPGTPDGDYGLATQNAVAEFQGSQGLAADGIAGPATLQALRKAVNK